MEFDALLLARIQFGFTIAFHIIFPTFTIGLSAYIAVLELIWLKTGKVRYAQVARFWTRIFAVSFGLGVVSGIVLSYEIGANWSRYSSTLGNVLGPLLAYEVLTAFFLEATFLGVMLFGYNRVPNWLHALSCVFVAAGTVMSAFWIMSANSWMHSPAGHELRDGIVYAKDWVSVVFNPTFAWRVTHMVIAAYLTTAFVVLAVGARFLLQRRYERDARTMMRMALGMIIVLAPLQLFVGDQHGLDALEYQPAKVAAMEAHWDGSKPGALVLFAWPDAEAETNHFEVAIPHGASLILTHDPDGLFPGLKDFPAADRPPILPVFFNFRLMVGIGFFMIFMAAWGGVLWWRGRLFEQRRFLQVASWSWPLGFIAVLAGWMVAEIGRQPWVATGILRTDDAVSPVTAGEVGASLIGFIIVYSIIFTAGIWYMNRLIVGGPDHEAGPVKGTPNRPLSGGAGG